MDAGEAKAGEGEVDAEYATRTRIINVSLELLDKHGAHALSTRAVCRAADIQAPTIYRIFGHKQGLINAAAVHGFERYIAKQSVGPPCPDPVDGLRRGWNLHVKFALDHPTLYLLTYGEPRPGPLPPAAAKAIAMLSDRVRRVAESGRLRMAEKHAIALLRAGACGTAMILIGTPEAERDFEISDLARESLISTITTSAPVAVEPDLISAAVHVRSALSDTTALTARECSLLEEWLDRIVSPASSGAPRTG